MKSCVKEILHKEKVGFLYQTCDGLDCRRKSEAAVSGTRFKAAIFLDKRWTFHAIADALLLTEEAIWLYMQNYEASK